MFFHNQLLASIPGCDVKALLDGKFRHEPTQALFELLPETEEAFLALDLDTAKGFTEAQITAMKTWQCARITELRAEAYRKAGITPEEYLNVVFDKKQTVAEFEAKRAAVKAAATPYPGTYRGTK